MKTLLVLGITMVLLPSLSAANLPDLPKPISSFGAAVLGDYLYVYGGHSGKVHTYSHDTTLGSFQRLSLKDAGATWEKLPSGRHLQGLALVATQGRIILIGGMEPQNKAGETSKLISTREVKAFDPLTKKWSDLPQLPVALSSHEAVVVKDKLYVVGGWTMAAEGKPEWSKKMYSIDLKAAEPQWSSQEQPFIRRALTAACYRNEIYVICGLNPDSGTEQTVNIFNPEKNSWRKGPEVPGKGMNGFTPAAAVVGDKLIVNPADGKIYQLQGDAWKEHSKVEFPRFVHRVVAVNDSQLIVIAGAARGGSRKDLERIDLR